jgi:hypothetical protein
MKFTSGRIGDMRITRTQGPSHATPELDVLRGVEPVRVDFLTFL